MRSIVVALAVLVGTVRSAHALCGTIEGHLSPAAGTPLPPDPTILLFEPDQDDPQITADRPFTTTVVSSGPGYRVIAIRIEARSGSVTLSHGSRSASVTYPIRRDAPRSARVITTHLESLGGWTSTCGGVHAITLEVEGTASAYRFDWHDGRAPTLVSAVRPSIGNLGCMEPNASRDDLAQVRGFDLVAVFADRSERRVGTSRLQLGDTIVRLPRELVDPAEHPWRMFVLPPSPRPQGWQLPIEDRLRPFDLDDGAPWNRVLALVGLAALAVLGRHAAARCR